MVVWLMIFISAKCVSRQAKDKLLGLLLVELLVVSISQGCLMADLNYIYLVVLLL